MSKTDEMAIKVNGVSKTFRLPHEKSTSMKSAFLNSITQKTGYELQEALKDVSFEVKKGEFFGIVGRNGSGKSTLLKCMAGVYSPSKGLINIKGKLVPFIELGVGFNPELSGRDNIFLNGALLGFSRKDMEAMYDEIVEFAELDQFMDQKLKNYSSGMQVRLAFSIAIRAQGDVLLLDEVLAVGDESFQRKCYEYFEKLKKDNRTVVLVTHGMENVRKYCDRAMLMQSGEVVAVGDPNSIADKYAEINFDVSKTVLKTSNKEDVKNEEPTLSAKIVGKRVLRSEDSLSVEIKYRALTSRPVIAKAYIDLSGHAIMATNPRLLNWDWMTTTDTKEHIATYTLPLKDFNKGEYKLIALLEDCDSKLNIANFGYGGETTFKIENLDTSSSGGVFINSAKMALKK